MKLIVNGSSMVPIYEQVMEQIKALILNGSLKENDVLPSVRTLAKELKISALTVKKAYDYLEQEGFTVTVHGKGTYDETDVRFYFLFISCKIKRNISRKNPSILIEALLQGIYEGDANE